MSERSKDSATRERTGTAYQMSSRQSRNYLSARVVSLIRANDSSGEFSGQELINIESILRDDMQTNPWLMSVCKAIADESVFVSKEELDLYNKYKPEEQVVTQSEAEELHKELDFLKERVHVLRYILKSLTEKLIEIHKNDSNDKDIENDINSQIWTKLRFKLRESLDLLKNDINSELCVEEPKAVAEQLVSILNDNLKAIDGTGSSDQWLNTLLDDLALSELNKRQISDVFNHFYIRLEDIEKHLIQLNEELIRIKEFYENDVTEEMSWRTDLNTLLTHLQSDCNSEAIQLTRIQTETNSLSDTKRLIEEYSQLWQRVQNQDLDQLKALINELKQRIECLSNKQ